MLEHRKFSNLISTLCPRHCQYCFVSRGGLAADLQRLMPVDSGNDLFLYQYPEAPSSEVNRVLRCTNKVYSKTLLQVIHVRPYRPEDRDACYSICLQVEQSIHQYTKHCQVEVLGIIFKIQENLIIMISNTIEMLFIVYSNTFLQKNAFFSQVNFLY